MAIESHHFKILTMISISEMLEKIPTAKMDADSEFVRIPIKEYENYRNTLSLQDKQSIIRDLQHLLNVKEQDLQRYREKYEYTESVLQRTQKALDKRLQVDQTQNSLPLKTTSLRSHPGIIPLRRSDLKPRNQSNSAGEVVCRAVGDESEENPASSLPNPASRIQSITDTSSLKSLPLNLSLGSPGMSTALFKRLIQENLKLKAQIEKRNMPRSSKDPEKTISDLKLRLEKKQQIIDDLVKSTNDDNEGQDGLSSRLTALHKENEQCNAMNEMHQLVINSLKEENSKYKREKEEMEALIIQYRKYKVDAEENNDRIAELEDRLKEEIDSRNAVIDSLKADINKVKESLEKTEQERDLLQKNYNTLVAQFHRSDRVAVSQPVYKMQTPQLQSAHLLQQQPHSGSISPQHTYNIGSPSSGSPVYGGSEMSRFTARSPQSVNNRRSSESVYKLQTGPKPLQESSAPTSPQRMSQSVYNTSTTTHQSPHPPVTAERKTFRCPRCDKVFTVLQQYRDHIKMCLKG